MILKNIFAIALLVLILGACASPAPVQAPAQAVDPTPTPIPPPKMSQQDVINDWATRIRGLIRVRANIPKTVTGKPVVQIRLKLLEDDSTFEWKIAKRSGNSVYDKAIEKALAGIGQWPLPTDLDLIRKNREIILNIENDK